MGSGDKNSGRSVKREARRAKRENSWTMSYGWQPSISFTASKYQRYGFVHEKPFLPGERYSVSREMVARQKRDRQSMDRPVVTSYYKSPVGTRSSKGSGAVFYSDPVERSYFFSGVKKI